MKLIYALALMPFAAFADPLSTDFDAIFEQNADAIETKNGGQSIELEGKILLSRNGEGKYLALDGGPFEAVGCVLSVTLQSTAVANVCPEVLTDAQTATLQENVQSFAVFYSANNVPSRPLAEVQSAFDVAISALTERFTNLKCDADEVGPFKDFVAALTNDDAQDRLAKSLATPRLPVTQPCT